MRRSSSSSLRREVETNFTEDSSSESVSTIFVGVIMGGEGGVGFEACARRSSKALLYISTNLFDLSKFFNPRKYLIAYSEPLVFFPQFLFLFLYS